MTGESLVIGAEMSVYDDLDDEVDSKDVSVAVSGLDGGTSPEHGGSIRARWVSTGQATMRDDANHNTSALKLKVTSGRHVTSSDRFLHDYIILWSASYRVSGFQARFR